MPGGSSSSRESSVSRPWKKQQPYLEDLYKRAESLYQGGPLQMYPGRMYAEQDPTTLEARGGMETYSRGMAEGPSVLGTSPLFRGGAGELARTAGGEYLTPSPYLDETYRRATRAFGRDYANIVGGGIAGRYGTSGRSGSPAEERALRGAQAELGTSMGDVAADIYGKAYEAERGRQFQAAGMLPALGTELAESDVRQRTGGYAGMEAVGLSREERDQIELDELISRFEFSQQEPYERLARYAGTIGAPVTTTMASGSSQSRQGLMGIFG